MKLNLSDIPKQDPFAVPDGYLQQLPVCIQQRVQAATAPAPVSRPRVLLLPQLQLAYSFLLFGVLAALVVLHQPAAPQPDAQVLLQHASRQEILQYLSESDPLSLQELSATTEAPSPSLYIEELPPQEVLEEDIAQHIDAYSAEELWIE